jgi:16S rRNA (cytosine1402-N4)-methyltransferase
MSLKNITAHKPVLVQEVLQYLNIQPGNTYLDVTFGSGGHTRAILEADPDCKVIAMDWDTKALEEFGQPLQEEFGDRLQLIWGNFAVLYRILKKEKIKKLGGILADFGTSQIQIAYRAGFSFKNDTELDMRMSPSHQSVTAAELLNKATQEKLAEIFFQLGEESKGRIIARAIVEERKIKPFKTTGQLAALIEKIIPQRGPVHPATKVFQALRIYINHEIENINAFLPAALQALAPKGRLVCISFHSLEDRIVKQYFKEQEHAGKIEIVTPKAIIGSEQEIIANPSARSAKLRACELVG